MSLNSNFVASFHLIGIFHYIGALGIDFVYVESGSDEYGGKFAFFTMWNVLIQLAYFLIAFITEFIGYSDVTFSRARRCCNRFRDYFFATFAFPLAFNVGFLFWLLFFIDRDFVASREFFDQTPVWFIHLTRTNCMVFIIIEAIINNHRYPNPVAALAGLMSVTLAYLLWVLFAYLQTDQWTYPILEKLDWPQRIGFFTFNIVVPVTFYFIGDLLNRQIWSRKWKCIEICRKGSEEVKQDGRRSGGEVIDFNDMKVSEV